MKSPLSKQVISLAAFAIPASLAAAGALVYVRYHRELVEAKARVGAGSEVANTPAGLIEYAAVGTGVPVLVIHGAGGGFDQGLEFARPLIDSGFRVIAPSRFGYLRTPLPENTSPMAQADAYASLLDFLHLDRVAVVAASAGAPSAVQFCLRHPDRCAAMVLVVPLAYSESASGSLPQEASSVRDFVINTAISSDFIFWAMSKLARKAMFQTILGTPPTDVEKAGPEEQMRLCEFLAHIEPISRRKKGLHNEAMIARSLPRYDLERIRVPTLLLAVENCLYKTYSGARYTAEHIQGARFVSYPTGGHLLVGHQKEAWLEIREFLNAALSSSEVVEPELDTRRLGA